MGHDKDLYEDAGSFKPERWIKEDREIQTFDQFAFPVFQGGPRLCLGKDLAIYEVKTLMVELVRKFRFEWPEELRPKCRSVFEQDVAMLNGVPVYQSGVALSFKGLLHLNIYKR